ncbi:hypothetical protein Lokhon_01390 [Limimaricola hongkongensis DSM 17492]|uniref:Uncharacterized protein n=1 Tax=Limimaricola hongkongensis DSM 17492 TaxID=1122180 RepID=A0A017HFP4_9RHOB|nr:hypothetical protein Lokhon_01390 [Limimaricola hongkongensis DSM 17492]
MIRPAEVGKCEIRQCFDPVTKEHGPAGAGSFASGAGRLRRPRPGGRSQSP